jgi:hypothetical protein
MSSCEVPFRFGALVLVDNGFQSLSRVATTQSDTLSSWIMAINKMVLTVAEVEQIRAQAAHAVAPLKPLSGGRYGSGGVRTDAGRELPPYYLVYFLLADLLNFPRGGKEEKVAWSIPVEFNGRAAMIEHRKLGLGYFLRSRRRTKLSPERLSLR